MYSVYRRNFLTWRSFFFARQVLNHDNEDARKAASALVEALLRQVESGYASSTRRRRKAGRGRIDRILREGQALGSL